MMWRSLSISPFNTAEKKLKNETALGNPSMKLNLTGAVPLIRHPKAPGGIPRRPKSAWQIFGSDFFKKYREAGPGTYRFPRH